MKAESTTYTPTGFGLWARPNASTRHSVRRPVFWLILRISLALSLFMFLTTVSFYYYQQRLADQQARMSFAQTVEVLSISISNFDYQAASLIAEILVQRDNVVGVSMVDDTGFVIADLGETDGERSYRYVVGHPEDPDTVIGVAEIFVPVPSPLLAALGAVTDVLFALGALVIPMTLIIWNYLARFVERPLEQLAAAINLTIESGKPQPTNYNENSLLGHVSRQFDAMQAHLRALDREKNSALTSLHRSHARLAQETERRRAYAHMIRSVLDTISQSSAFFDDKDQPIFRSDQRVAGKPVAALFTKPIRTIEAMREWAREHDAELRELPVEQAAKDIAFSCEVEFSDKSVWLVQAVQIDRTVAGQIATDITSVRAQQNQWLQSKKMESVGILASGVAHDVNNSLAIISGYAEQLSADATLTEQQRNAVFAICSATDRSGSIVSQLMSFSRVRFEAQEAFALSEALHDAKTMIAPLLGPNVETELSLPQTDLELSVDRNLFASCIINLAKNAKNAMPSGGKFSISAALADADLVRSKGLDPLCPHVRVSFNDTGAGVRPENIDKLFLPFYTERHRQSGTGLGLAMVYNFCKQAGGTIWCESVFGEGASFVMLLPATALHEPRSAPRTTAQARPAIEPKCLNGLNVFVLDDERELVTILSKACSALGAEVRSERSLSRARERIGDREFPPDIILTDVVLADGNGLDFAREAHRHWPDASIVVMSGNLDAMAEDLVGEGVATSLMSKPFSLGELSSVLKQCKPGSLVETGGPTAIASEAIACTRT